MSSAASLEDDIIAIVRAKTERKTVEVTPETDLLSLGLESLDIIEIIFEVEEKYDIEIPFNANADGAFDMATVGEMIASVRAIIDRGIDRGIDRADDRG